MNEEKYIVEMVNPKNGRVEAYSTVTDDPGAIDRALEYFRACGYDIISCRKAEELTWHSCITTP